jgi:putative sigma-54 modulation protein
MKVTTTSRHYDLTAALKDYAESKVHNLKKYFDQIVNAHITFSLEKYRHTVEISVHVNGGDFQAKEVSEDMYASVDGAVEKLERQILKYKGKIKKRKNQPSLHDVEINLDKESLDTKEEVKLEDLMVAASADEFPLLSLEEAIQEMNGNGEMVKIFSNSQTKQVNVIYKREDGKLGIIEA